MWSRKSLSRRSTFQIKWWGIHKNIFGSDGRKSHITTTLNCVKGKKNTYAVCLSWQCESLMQEYTHTGTLSIQRLKTQVWRELCLFGMNELPPTSPLTFLHLLLPLPLSSLLCFLHTLSTSSSLTSSEQCLSLVLSHYASLSPFILLSFDNCSFSPLLLVFILSSVLTFTHGFRGMSGMCLFLQHHVVVTHMTATPELEECECFFSQSPWMDGWMEA